MTREEQTISNLKKLKSFHNGSYGTDIDRAIKALEQEPISCQSCKHLNEDTEICLECEYDGTTRGMTKYEEQEPCENAISRQAVKEQMLKYGFHAPDMTVIEFVEDILPVNPQPKTGHWIYKTVRGEKVPCCSRCGLDNGTHDKFNFCPECGAEMIEP